MNKPAILAGCHTCGLVQRIPLHGPELRPVCQRCATPLKHTSAQRNRLTVALAASALVFYLPAMTLPLLRIERLGHAHQDSLLSGVAALLGSGYWLVGTVVLLFSVVLPPVKLLALGLLCTAPSASGHHRALIYHLVELLGRWGMLDVMLVAILVAFVKLGNLVNIHAGPGLTAFIALVLLSLLASLAFNPQLMWEDPEPEP